MFSNLEPPNDKFRASLLGGSWVVISRVISPLIGVIILVTLLITPLITTHEPPSRSRSPRGTLARPVVASDRNPYENVLLGLRV